MIYLKYDDFLHFVFSGDAIIDCIIKFAKSVA